MKYIENLVKFMLSIQLRRYFSVVLHFIIFFLLTLTVSFTQTTEKKYSFGALLLTKEQYAKLARPNWDTLRKYSNLKTKSSKSTKSIVTLVSPPIEDQGSQGSCVGWSTGYAALSILAYPKYNCWLIASRSPSYVFNQIKVSCSAGAYLSDAITLVKNQGSCSINLMQYNENDCSTQPNSTQIFEASKHVVTNGYAIYPNNDVDEIKQAIDLGYPVPCAFDVYESFINDWNDDGIWDSQNTGDFLGSHAVCIVGYDDVQQLFKVQNSWGTDSGDNGFFWVSFDLVEEGYISELYILYGMDASYPESISGNSILCTSGVTFTLDNPPSNCSFSWNSSSNLTLDSYWDNSALFTPNSGANSSGYIQVAVNSCSFTIPQKNVWIGIPSTPGTIGFERAGGTCYYRAYISSVPGAESYDWSEDNVNWNMGYSTYYGLFDPYSTVTVYVRARNSCGVSATNSKTKTMGPPPPGCMWKSSHIIPDTVQSESLIAENIRIYPNPAETEVTISVSDASSSSSASDNEDLYISSVTIIDSYGKTRIIKQYRSGLKSVTINISDLSKGFYFIRVNNNVAGGTYKFLLQ
jgi:C1A family cysteine protease